MIIILKIAKKNISDEEEKKEDIETEINDSLESKNAKKYDVSQKTETSFIYRNSRCPIILEDQTIKDRNKVKSTLNRYILTNLGDEEKYFEAKRSIDGENDLAKINCFVPSIITDKINEQNNVNFFNVMRKRGDLPFFKSDNCIFEINEK